MKTQLTIVALTILAALTTISGSAAEMANPVPENKSSLSGQEIELKKAHEAAEVLSSSQKAKLLNLLNKGSEKELVAIKGIAAGRTKAIIAERPYQTVEDVVKVKGIGLSTFSSVIKHGKNPPVSRTSKKS